LDYFPGSPGFKISFSQPLLTEEIREHQAGQETDAGIQQAKALPNIDRAVTTGNLQTGYAAGRKVFSPARNFDRNRFRRSV
jgi:hypothetical protein